MVAPALLILYDNIWRLQHSQVKTDTPTCSTDKVCEYETIKLKEGSSTSLIAVPSRVVSCKPPVEVSVDHCPAYRVITTPSKPRTQRRTEGMDGIQSDGVYVAVKL